MDAIDAERDLCGLQEIFTDFDRWICKLNRYLNKRHTREELLKSEDCIKIQILSRESIAAQVKENVKLLSSLTLQRLLVEGLCSDNIHLNNYNKSKAHIVMNLDYFLNIFQDGDEFAVYDYLLFKLLSVIQQMVSESKEWRVTAPWGNIACVSWGGYHNRAILMVHGFMDTAATFIPIVNHMPEDYFYVAIDLPGHGMSDPFPIGMPLSQVNQVEAVRRVVEHFKWDKFVYISHSVGFAIGVLYNYLYPFKIERTVNLDPVPPLSRYCLHQYSPVQWYRYQYDEHYDNYSKWELQRNKQYTYDQAIDLLVRSRKLTKEQSEVVLSRTLIPLENGKFKLSWEPTMRKVISACIPEDTLIKIMTTNAPPILNIMSSIDDVTSESLKKNGIRLMKIFKESIPVFLEQNVTGTHDVHITNPESFVGKVIEFLNIDYSTITMKSKL